MQIHEYFSLDNKTDILNILGLLQHAPSSFATSSARKNKRP